MDLYKLEYEALFQKMKASLPIKAYPIRELVQVFRNNKNPITLNTILTITDVFNSGDISGIMCTISNDGDNVTACGLTHLVFTKVFHLYNEIVAYQKKRIKRIEQLNRL